MWANGHGAHAPCPFYLFQALACAARRTRNHPLGVSCRQVVYARVTTDSEAPAKLLVVWIPSEEGPPVCRHPDARLTHYCLGWPQRNGWYPSAPPKPTKRDVALSGGLGSRRRRKPGATGMTGRQNRSPGVGVEKLGNGIPKYDYIGTGCDNLPHARGGARHARSPT